MMPHKSDEEHGGEATAGSASKDDTQDQEPKSKRSRGAAAKPAARKRAASAAKAAPVRRRLSKGKTSPVA